MSFNRNSHGPSCAFESEHISQWWFAYLSHSYHLHVLEIICVAILELLARPWSAGLCRDAQALQLLDFLPWRVEEQLSGEDVFIL